MQDSWEQGTGPWLANASVCNWTIVNCVNGTIPIELRIVNRGTINPNLADIPSTITQVYVSGNNINGTLGLHQLPATVQALRIVDNIWAGPVNLALLPASLTVLDLTSNNLTGPAQLQALPLALLNLSLANNNLSGILNLAQLPPGLLELRLNDNSFSGALTFPSLPVNLSTIALFGTNHYTCPHPTVPGLADLETSNCLLVQGLNVSSSVHHDQAADVYYITNSQPSAAYLSSYNPSTRSFVAKWCQLPASASAVDGVVVYNNVVYATARTTVHKCSASNGMYLGSIDFCGNPVAALTGLAVSAASTAGRLYVTDKITNMVYSVDLTTDKVSPLPGATRHVTRPSGIAVDGGAVVVVESLGRSITWLDAEDGSFLNRVQSPLYDLDGIVTLAPRTYLLSHRMTMDVYALDPMGNYHVVATALTLPMDIGYDATRNLVLMPTEGRVETAPMITLPAAPTLPPLNAANFTDFGLYWDMGTAMYYAAAKSPAPAAIAAYHPVKGAWNTQWCPLPPGSAVVGTIVAYDGVLYAAGNWTVFKCSVPDGRFLGWVDFGKPLSHITSLALSKTSFPADLFVTSSQGIFKVELGPEPEVEPLDTSRLFNVTGTANIVVDQGMLVVVQTTSPYVVSLDPDTGIPVRQVEAPTTMGLSGMALVQAGTYLLANGAGAMMLKTQADTFLTLANISSPLGGYDPDRRLILAASVNGTVLPLDPSLIMSVTPQSLSALSFFNPTAALAVDRFYFFGVGTAIASFDVLSQAVVASVCDVGSTVKAVVAHDGVLQVLAGSFVHRCRIYDGAYVGNMSLPASVAGTAMAIDPEDGTLYIAGNGLWKVTEDGAQLLAFNGTTLVAVVVEGDMLVVADTGIVNAVYAALQWVDRKTGEKLDKLSALSAMASVIKVAERQYLVSSATSGKLWLLGPQKNFVEVQDYFTAGHSGQLAYDATLGRILVPLGASGVAVISSWTVPAPSGPSFTMPAAAYEATTAVNYSAFAGQLSAFWDFGTDKYYIPGSDPYGANVSRYDPRTNTVVQPWCKLPSTVTTARGVGVYNGVLYIAGKSPVAIYKCDLFSGQYLNFIAISGAASLADVVIDRKAAKLYATDDSFPGGTYSVFSVNLATEQVTGLVARASVTTPEAAVLDEGYLVMVGAGMVSKVDASTGTLVKAITAPQTQLSGIARLAPSTYLVQTPAGAYLLDPFDQYTLVDTPSVTASNIGYDSERGRLLVPVGLGLMVVPFTSPAATMTFLGASAVWYSNDHYYIARSNRTGSAAVSLWNTLNGSLTETWCQLPPEATVLTGITGYGPVVYVSGMTEVYECTQLGYAGKLPVPGATGIAGIAADATRLYMSDASGQVLAMNVSTRAVAPLTYTHNVLAQPGPLALHQGTLLVAEKGGNSIYYVKIISGEVYKTVEGPVAKFTGIAVLGADGRYLVSTASQVWMVNQVEEFIPAVHRGGGALGYDARLRTVLLVEVDAPCYTAGTLHRARFAPPQLASGTFTKVVTPLPASMAVWTMAKYPDVVIVDGGKLLFTVMPGMDLYQFADGAAYASCDATTGLQLQAVVTVPTNFTLLTWTGPGNYYIGTSIYDFCSRGMKFTMTATTADGTSPTHVVTASARPVWTAGFQYARMTLSKMDRLTFISNGAFDLVYTTSPSVFAACNNLSMTPVAPSSNFDGDVPVYWTATTPGTYYFTSTVNNNMWCRFGMGLVVDVVGYSPRGILAPEILLSERWMRVTPTKTLKGSTTAMTLTGFLGNRHLRLKFAEGQVDCAGVAPGLAAGGYEVGLDGQVEVPPVTAAGVYLVCVKYDQDWEPTQVVMQVQELFKCLLSVALYSKMSPLSVAWFLRDASNQSLLATGGFSSSRFTIPSGSYTLSITDGLVDTTSGTTSYTLTLDGKRIASMPEFGNASFTCEPADKAAQGSLYFGMPSCQALVDAHPEFCGCFINGTSKGYGLSVEAASSTSRALMLQYQGVVANQGCCRGTTQRVTYTGESGDYEWGLCQTLPNN